MNDTNMLTNYKLVKDSIIEYCVTDVKDISTIIDNVAFFNSMEIEDVEKRLNIYMSSYGDTSKVMNVFSRYSEDYINNIRKSNLPETYIPIFSKAVAQKIKEMQNNRQK